MASKAQELEQRFAALTLENRLPHAILLEGGNPQDVLRLAKKIASMAVCTDPAKRPCGKCPACTKAKAGHPDIQLIEEADKKRKTISVDRIRRLREDAIVKPNEAIRKVYLIPKADTMTREAQNALLKLLEEPPSYAVFLLLCTKATELLPTIRSRTQIFSLEENPVLGVSAAEQAAAIAAAIPSKDPTALLFAAAPLIKGKDREKVQLVFSGLELILRDCIVRRAGGTTLISGADETVEQLHRAISQRKLMAALELLETASFQNERNCNLALLITCLCAKLHRLVNH